MCNNVQIFFCRKKIKKYFKSLVSAKITQHTQRHKQICSVFGNSLRIFVKRLNWIFN